MAWDLALMQGKMISPESWKTMTTPRPLSDGRSSGYGCGQRIRDRGPVLVLQHGGAVSGFNANNAFIPSSRSAVVVMANADWSGGVISAISEAVLAKMMPVADAPVVAGRPAKDVALDLLSQIRAGKVDRSLLGDEFSAFLTPERLAVMSKSLVDAGEVSGIETGPTSERGGMEVSQVRLLVGTTPDQDPDVSHARRQGPGVPVQPALNSELVSFQLRTPEGSLMHIDSARSATLRFWT